MEYNKLGRTDLTVSGICLGMMSFNEEESDWHVGEQAADEIVRAAIEGGVTFFDTAEGYGDGSSERVTGRILPKYLKREEMVVATKVHPNGGALTRDRIRSAIDGSLARLNMDYVDLFQIHRWDPATPIEETMAALDEVVRSGKARYVGASSMAAWQFAKAQHAGPTKFATMQNHYNLVYREEEREMIPYCLDDGVAVLPYSPLARGLLAGNRTRSGERKSLRAASDRLGHRLATDADFAVIDRLTEVAAARNAKPARIALSWLRGRPGVAAPILGATKVHHVTDALDSIALTETETAYLEELYVPHAVMGHQ